MHHVPVYYTGIKLKHKIDTKSPWSKHAVLVCRSVKNKCFCSIKLIIGSYTYECLVANSKHRSVQELLRNQKPR